LGLGATIASAVAFDHKLYQKVVDDLAHFREDNLKGASSPSMVSKGGKILTKAKKAVSRRIRGTMVSYRRGGLRAAMEGVIRRTMKRINR
jgi:hypothetical protein